MTNSISIELGMPTIRITTLPIHSRYAQYSNTLSGATTLSITILNVKKTQFIALSITTFMVMTLSLTALSITTLSITILSINDTQRIYIY
jgi:hypothetical protein